jgi:polysaccharide biosynthesis/export protein
VNVRFFFALALAASPVACATTPPFEPGPHLTRVEGSELPPPIDVDPTTGHRPFRIGPLDTIAVNVFGLPELSRSIQVDSGGAFALPLVGTLSASGKTPEELSGEIATRLRASHVRQPQVSVNLEQAVSQVVTIDGQVREPGMYPVLEGMTLMRGMASAKGVTEFARLQDVVVFRRVGDRDMAAIYNLQAIRRGAYPDPPIFAGDVLVVGDSPARRMFRDLLQASGLLIAPVVALIQR